MNNNIILVPYVKYTCDCGCVPKVICDVSDDGYIDKATGICTQCGKPCERDEIVYLQQTPEQTVSLYSMCLAPVFFYPISDNEKNELINFYILNLREVLSNQLPSNLTEYWLKEFQNKISGSIVEGRKVQTEIYDKMREIQEQIDKNKKEFDRKWRTQEEPAQKQSNDNFYKTITKSISEKKSEEQRQIEEEEEKIEKRKKRIIYIISQSLLGIMSLCFLSNIVVFVLASWSIIPWQWANWSNIWLVDIYILSIILSIPSGIIGSFLSRNNGDDFEIGIMSTITIVIISALALIFNSELRTAIFDLFP